MKVDVTGADRLSVEDKTTRTMVPIKSMVIGLEGLNPAPGINMDQEEFEKDSQRELDNTDHTVESWKKLGLLNSG